MKDVRGIILFSGGTENEGELCKIDRQLTANERKLKEYCRALWGDQANFIVTKPKSSAPPPRGKMMTGCVRMCVRVYLCGGGGTGLQAACIVIIL